jgi:hypothetical protein
LPRLYKFATRPLFAIGISQEAIGLLPALIGAEVVSVLEIDRIHSSKRNELFQIDAVVSFRLQTV